MDPATLNILIYAGIAAGGYLVHWIQARHMAPVVPGGPATPAPTTPHQLTIGHGLLLDLFLNAFKAGLQASPPASPMGPGPSPMGPPSSSSPIDIAALVQMFLSHQQAMQPATPTPKP